MESCKPLSLVSLLGSLMLTSDDISRSTTQKYASLDSWPEHCPIYTVANLARQFYSCSTAQSEADRTPDLPASTEGRSRTTSRLDVLGT